MAISPERQAQVDYERRRMAYHDEITRQKDAWQRGFEEGLRLSLFDILQERGLSLNAAQRTQVDAETDVERLKHWTGRAAVASSAEAVFAG